MGYLALTIVGISSPGRRGKRWYNSSVTNGINGWSSLRPASKQVYNVSWADRLRFALLTIDVSASVNGFINSYKFKYY